MNSGAGKAQLNRERTDDQKRMLDEIRADLVRVRKGELDIKEVNMFPAVQCYDPLLLNDYESFGGTRTSTRA